MLAVIGERALRELKDVLPVETDPDALATYGRDWTRVYDPAPSAVVFPRSTAEVSAVLAICHRHGVAVVPSGGRTGLAGGAVAKDGELVLSLERMRAIGPVDTIGGTVHVEAGAITEAVHQAVEEHDLSWPIDFASKGSSHVGGNIATNAGGVKVIRYGLTRQWVLGLTVVLADGTVLDLDAALEKNNTGVDLRQLFIGSEGTLGVITEATLKLARAPGHLDVFFFGVDSLAGVLRVFEAARKGPFVISAFEMLTDRCLARLERHRGLRSPLEADAPCFVLLEVEAHDRDALDAWLESVVERELVLDGVLAAGLEQARSLWTLREGISESLSATGLPHKNDVALPIAALTDFCRELEEVFEARYPGWEICLFGHIGDGNLHINVMKPDDMGKEAFLERVHEADRSIFELVAKHHGSISAEHGIGLLKRDGLGYSRSAPEIAVMRAMKAALDPKGILNPGKVFAERDPAQ
ncbi:MAG: FAD-binding oxidoreductase [Sandaracinaceae bacterium]|nr:FAD-binding oxidoreductase [Sandaracinaceae bacterium]